jgi:CheY-like chemotaxis protein/anti-sigma regulatory factor (Ser/Thr protein kinase)
LGLLATFRRDLAEIEDGVERIRRIVADLNRFARPDRGPTNGDLDSALRWAIRVTGTLVKSRARLIENIDSLPPVQGATARMGQVFVNLLVNAAQAIEDGDPESQVVAVTASASADGVVEVAIRDTGCGMTPDVMRRIFDPFFTTKPVGSGTGLGLSVCRGIIDSIGGVLNVESQTGEGTTFRVRLPVATERRKRSVPPKDQAKLRGHVLVIDDNEVVARSIARTLDATHVVELTSDARDALAMLEAGPGFDVVVCDLRMPGMSGIELHERLSQRDLDQAERFLFVSGAFTAEVSEFLARIPNPRLPKPPSVEELERCVQAILRVRGTR